MSRERHCWLQKHRALASIEQQRSPTARQPYYYSICTVNPGSRNRGSRILHSVGTTLTRQNPIQKEIKSRLKSGNACYHSVQNLMSSSLLSRNLKIKIYRNIIFPVVLYGCETWFLTLREKSRLGGCLRIGC